MHWISPLVTDCSGTEAEMDQYKDCLQIENKEVWITTAPGPALVLGSGKCYCKRQSMSGQSDFQRMCHDVGTWDDGYC